ncbi:hypothetical protein SteCoe_35472 [Stentor coeruleus]|uniref:Uncharacterized protein n=1 Tax=Stentor coeruleus TaxID=5963 RepID=A0A1R2AS85_9CILI|nr:hypothetical protein SteCoe_35472 [Stentor coeruleus]
MKTQKLNMTHKSKYLRVENLEVVKTERLGGKINIKVRFLQAKPESKSPAPLKFTPTTTHASTSYCEELCLTPIKVFVSLNSPTPAKPDDFIEPFTNIAIPSTEEFLRHKHFSEPIPEIIDNKRNTGISYQSVKKSRPQKSKAITRSLQLQRNYSQASVINCSIFGSTNKTQIKSQSHFKPISKNLSIS